MAPCQAESQEVRNRDARDEAAREEEELQAVLALSLKEFEAQKAADEELDMSPASPSQELRN